MTSTRHAPLMVGPPTAGALLAFLVLSSGVGVAAGRNAPRRQQGRAAAIAAVDSASTARAAWGRAVNAAQAGHFTDAAREATASMTAWPRQEAYVWGRAVLSARAHDTAGTIDALRAYADLGLGRDLRAQPALGPYLSLPAVADLLVRHDANRAPTGRATAMTLVRDTTFWPEGMDVDVRTGHYFIASIRHRTVIEVDSTGAVLRELPPRGTKGVGSIMAVRVDRARGVLWATTVGLPQMDGFQRPDTAIAALLEIRLADGVILRRWMLPPTALGHAPGDVALGANGDVYLSDSRDPVLYRLAAGEDTLRSIRDPLFRSLQGVAPTPNVDITYVADYSHGLLRVDVARGAVDRVGEPRGTTFFGCDGLVWYGDGLLAVQNGVSPARVLRIALSSDGRRATAVEVLDRDPAPTYEPTIGAVSGDRFTFVASSQWNAHDDDGRRTGTTPLPPVILRSVALRTSVQKR